MIGVDSGLLPLLAQSVDPAAQRAAGGEAAGISVDQLLNSRQDDSTGSVGFDSQDVAGLESASWNGTAGIVIWRPPDTLAVCLARSATDGSYRPS